MPNSDPNFLNRWLDRNPKTILTRTRNFLVIPAFTIQYQWLGYSDIVGLYDYSAPNTFTFRNLAGLPNGPQNYTLIISYVNPDRTVVRYKLLSGVGEKIFETIPLYTGQLIKKNFRIEIWSTPSLVSTQATDIKLNTSVLNNVDYRYGTDTALAGENNFTTVFGSVLDVSAPQGTPDPTGLVMWFEGGNIVDVISPPNVDTWTDTIGGLVLTPTNGTPIRRTFSFVTGAQCLGSDQLQGTGAIINPMPHIYIAFFGPITQANANKIVRMSFGAAAPQVTLTSLTTFQNREAITLGGVFPFTSSGANYIELNLVSGICNIYNWGTGVLIGTGTIGPSTSKISRVTVGDSGGLAGAGNIICRILGYNAIQSDAGRQRTLQFLTGTPISFPYTPVINTY